MEPRPRPEHPLSRRTAARLAAALYVLCGLLVAAVAPVMPADSELGLVGIGVTAVVSGALIAVLPWDRWPRPAILVFTVLALGLIALHNVFTGADGFRYALLFTVTLAWVGLSFPSGTPLLFAPLTAIAYVVPLVVVHDGLPADLAASALYGVVLSVLVGETVAWVTTRLGRTQQALEQSDAAWQGVFADSPVPMWVFDRETLRFLAVNEAAVASYGWTEEEFLRMRITDVRPSAQVEPLLDDLRRDHAASDPGGVWTHRTKRGELLQVEVHGRPVPAWGPRARLVVALDVTERMRAQEALAQRALRDDLTGLPSRALLTDRLAQALDRPAYGAGLLLLDLDRFRRLNEQHGTAAGDDVLRDAGQRVRGLLPRGATVGRWGSDEFLVVVEAVDRAALQAWGERVLAALSTPFAAGDATVELSACVGASLAAPGADVAAVLTDAENALALARSRGTGQLAFLDGAARHHAATRRTVEQELPAAIERGELHLVYQPQVSLADGAVRAVEALVRWDSPGRGLVPPSEFIPVAEETGLVVQLGEWVLSAAVAEVSRWPRELVPRVSVNVSAVQLADRGFVGRVVRVLEEHGVSADRLRLEITEHALLAPAAQETLPELADAGIGLSIDDFGTGWSSLASLRRLPVDEIKVDRSFVQGVLTSERDRTIVRGVVRLGTEMRLTTVAEGIETVEQAEHLAALGCDLGQGFLWSRPLVPEQLDAWLAARRLPEPRSARRAVRSASA